MYQLPAGLPASVAPISPAGVRLAEKLTIFDTCGDVLSLPQAAAATAAAIESATS